MKVFVSHSSQDVELVTTLIDLLRFALNLKAVDIRCTSVDGYRLPAGVRTEDQLRAEAVEAPVFLGLLSPASSESVYVAFELGARWGAGKHLVPLLARASMTDLLGGPLRGLNALATDSEAQLHQLVSDLATILEATPESPAAYGRYVRAVVTAAERRVELVDEDHRESSHSWPAAPSYETLRTLFHRLSAANKQIMAAVAGKQMYAGDLSSAVAIDRNELVYRCKELEALQLLHVENLTDKRYELHSKVRRVLGGNAARLITAIVEEP